MKRKEPSLVEHLDEVEVDLVDEINERSQERTVPFKPNQKDRRWISIE